MILSDEWAKIIEDHCGDTINKVSAIHGGDINKAVSFYSGNQKYFFKFRLGLLAKSIFAAEIKGLQLIQSSGTLQTPIPVHLLNLNKDSGLLMPFIKSGSKSSIFWNNFGTQLASLHSETSDLFGLDFNNFIGTINQTNLRFNSWAEFYAQNRILPLVKMCFDQSLLQKNNIIAADHFCKRIENIYPSEPPSLLHGDLWKGNYICSQGAVAYLIDPAPYYGHREMDVAMTMLFGGFENSFYEHYESLYPLEPGWYNRMKYSQLYYLLVHLFLFGSSYKDSVAKVLMEFET